MLSAGPPQRARRATHSSPSSGMPLPQPVAATADGSSPSASSSSSSSSTPCEASTISLVVPAPAAAARQHRLAARPPPPPTDDDDNDNDGGGGGEQKPPGRGRRRRRRFSFVSSTDALQGRRAAMEDSHISIDDLARYYPDLFAPFQRRGLPNALYGIYDGHVGKRASAFVSDTLHDRICRDPAFPAAALLPLLLPAEVEEEKKEEKGPDEEMEKEKDDGKEEAKEGSGCGGAAATATTVEQVTDGICRAMEAGFLQTDREFIEDAVREENRWKDGSTAVVALLLDAHLFLANLGDSEALLGKREYNRSAGAWEESFEVLSEIHKPTVPAERARIEKEGGFIIGGRVGGLSISRSFGDRNMKLPIEEDGFWHGVLVDPHPHVMHRKLVPTSDCFLLLGCDGVWENWSHQESVEFVFEKLDEGLNVDELTEAVTRQAHAKGSQDNISATILLFRWAEA